MRNENHQIRALRWDVCGVQGAPGLATVREFFVIEQEGAEEAGLENKIVHFRV